MRNKEIAKGLKLIAEGFTALASAYELGEDTVVKTIVETSKEVVKEIPVEEAPVKEQAKVVQMPKAEEVTPEIQQAEETTSSGEKLTEAELNAKSYNDIKALAKQLGVKAVGSKKSIIDNILAYYYPVATEEQVEQVEETVEEIEEVAEQNPEVEEDIEDIEADEETGETSLYDQVVADLEGYSDEELADILSEIGISPKGKRQALLSKIVQAIEDGKLEFGDDVEETAEDEVTPVDEKEEEVEAVEETEEEESEEVDFIGSETRRRVCEDLVEKIDGDVESGNLSHKEILKFLKDYNNGNYVSRGVHQDVEEYMIIQCDLIDDEGELHDFEDPYYIGDDVYCCASKLKTVDGDLYCEICGTTYENE